MDNGNIRANQRWLVEEGMIKARVCTVEEHSPPAVHVGLIEWLPRTSEVNTSAERSKSCRITSARQKKETISPRR